MTLVVVGIVRPFEGLTMKNGNNGWALGIHKYIINIYIYTCNVKIYIQYSPDIKTMKHERVYALQIWVITPKNEGCGFPWQIMVFLTTTSRRFSCDADVTCPSFYGSKRVFSALPEGFRRSRDIPYWL